MVQTYSLQQAIDQGVLEGASCAFGVFDGLHRGHARLIGKTIEASRGQGGRAVVLTFDIDPDELFRSATLRKLMSNEQRLSALASSGVDAVCAMPFTRSLAQLEPGDFLDKALLASVPAHIFCGENMHFGAGAQGDVATLREWASVHGLPMQVHAMPLLEYEGEPVSSTRIRGCLARGDIGCANTLLGHAYELVGTVEEGRHDGRALGFPTANLNIDAALRVLADGVYAAYAEVDGQVFRAAASMGESPSFAQEGAASLEVHLLDFDRDIYGRQLRVRFCKRLRPLIAFDSLGDLASTVQDNIAWVRDNMPCEEERPVHWRGEARQVANDG